MAYTPAVGLPRRPSDGHASGGAVATDGGRRRTVPRRRDRDATGVVLVADDDVDFAETVEHWLEPAWDVVLAHDGDEAVEAYDAHVDAVLLDRRMPTQSGDDALDEIREQEGESRIAMMTAVDPDWDVVDMPFDMYLQKPLSHEELEGAVEELYRRADYTREVRSMFALSWKLGALEDRYPPAALEDDERYQRLEAEFERVQAQAERRLGDVDVEEFKQFLQIVDGAARSRG